MDSIKEYIFIGLKYIATGLAIYFALSNVIGCAWNNLKSVTSQGDFNMTSTNCIFVIILTCILFIWALMECPDIFNKYQKKCEYKTKALKLFNDVLYTLYTLALGLVLLCATKRNYSIQLVIGISVITILLLLIYVIYTAISDETSDETSDEKKSMLGRWTGTIFYSITSVVFIIALFFIENIPFLDICSPGSYLSEFLHKYILIIILCYIPIALFKIFTGISKDVDPNKIYNKYNDKYQDELKI